MHVLTREHGLVNLLARGAYRPKSRYYAVLDLFDGLQLCWSDSRDKELKTLIEGELCTRRRGLTRDLDCYDAGLSMLELAHLGSRSGHAEPELFDELVRGLDRLHERGTGGTAPPADQTRLEFELSFLRLHGLSPALMSCAACGRGAAPTASANPHGHPRAWFSAGAGGRLCAPCAADARASGRRVGTLPLDVLVAADRMSDLQRRAEPRAPVPPERLLRVRDFVERFLGYQLETRPRSHRIFLESANRNAPTS